MLGTNNISAVPPKLRLCLQLFLRTDIHSADDNGSAPRRSILERSFSPALRSPFTPSAAPRSHPPRLAVPVETTLLVSVNGLGRLYHRFAVLSSPFCKIFQFFSVCGGILHFYPALLSLTCRGFNNGKWKIANGKCKIGRGDHRSSVKYRIKNS